MYTNVDTWLEETFCIRNVFYVVLQVRADDVMLIRYFQGTILIILDPQIKNGVFFFNKLQIFYFQIVGAVYEPVPEGL